MKTAREYKIKLFIEHHHAPKRWCSAQACFCMGCINVNDPWGQKWAQLFPGESEITKEDIELYLRHTNI